MSLLPNLIDSPRPHQPLLLIQSSAAQSGLSILRQSLQKNLEAKASKGSPTKTLLFCFLHPPSCLVVDESSIDTERLAVHDYLDNIPGYLDSWSDCRHAILSAVNEAGSQPLNVVLDSVDTLYEDIGSLSETYKFLRKLLTALSSGPSPSRLVLHIQSPSALIPLLTQISFSPSLVHLIAHPPALLYHIATEYMTPPPPASEDAKFWGVFLPIREREYETERLVFGSNGEGSGDSLQFVVEVLVRGPTEGPGRRKGVERVLEGWNDDTHGPCELIKLESLKSLWKSRIPENSAPDPTQNVSFNLNLTPAQQQSRAQVPLPYAHDGKPSESTLSSGAIFYDPDSADDIDDDDPDEDLDI